MRQLAHALRESAPTHPPPALALEHLRRRQPLAPALRQIDEAAFAHMIERAARLPGATCRMRSAWVEALRGGPDALARLGDSNIVAGGHDLEN